MSLIALIAPSKEIETVARQAKEKYNLDMDIFLGLMEEGVKISKELYNQGYKVFISHIMKNVVNIVLSFTPIGVFGLMANVIGNNGIEILIPYAKVIAAVYVASAIQTVVFTEDLSESLSAVLALRNFYELQRNLQPLPLPHVQVLQQFLWR